jgi:hypothetical protein
MATNPFSFRPGIQEYGDISPTGQQWSSP